MGRNTIKEYADRATAEGNTTEAISAAYDLVTTGDTHVDAVIQILGVVSNVNTVAAEGSSFTSYDELVEEMNHA